MLIEDFGRLKLRVLPIMLVVLVSGCVNVESPTTKTDVRPQQAATAPLVIDVDDVRVLGDPKATVAIVEYADYECPYCRQFHATMLPKLKAEFIDKGVVRYFYKDLPIRSHPQAFNASVATFCAAQQKRYWPMHDKLYTTSQRLHGGVYGRMAKELGLDVKKFEACRGGRRAHDAINYDLSQAASLGISATPTFIIGSIKDGSVVVERMATGTPSFETFAREIEALRR